MKHTPLNTLEIAFAFFLIAFPFFEGQLPQFKRKVHEYVKISVTLWAVTIFVIFASIWDAFDIQAPHYLPSSDITSIICGILIVGLVAYTTYSSHTATS